MMPKVDGIEVCRRLRADPAFPFTPIIMVTAMADPKDVDRRPRGRRRRVPDQAGGPRRRSLARVRSMLRIKACTTRQELAAELKRVERLARAARAPSRSPSSSASAGCRRFFSPQLAELIVSGGADDPLQSHRREITVVFLDLRGFTAFAETRRARGGDGRAARVPRARRAS